MFADDSTEILFLYMFGKLIWYIFQNYREFFLKWLVIIWNICRKLEIIEKIHGTWNQRVVSNKGGDQRGFWPSGLLIVWNSRFSFRTPKKYVFRRPSLAIWRWNKLSFLMMWLKSKKKTWNEKFPHFMRLRQIKANQQKNENFSLRMPRI